MGSCLGKEHTGSSMSLPNDEARQPPIDDDVDAISSDNPHPESTSGPCRPVLVVSRAKIDSLVLENLSVIRTLFDYDQEPPSSMMQLHFIADQEDGWLQVVQSMIDVIPMQDALGPANITLLLDDCPLPSKETVIRLTQVLDLSRATSIQGRSCPNRHRNICIVLGCMAETLAGPRCLDFFTDSTLDYLLANLDECVSPDVILFALIALEKFAQTSENKVTICKRLLADSSRSHCNPLVKLEKWRDLKNDWFRRQVGFCAQWCLDNLFVLADRPLSYTIVDMSHINAVLNSNDVSEYLKISPEGLEARCDAASFESVRCTFQVDAGAWYYEVIVVTGGVMQIGWATKDSKFLNYEGYGIGDDEFSLAYDGCRQWMWHNAVSHSQEHLVPRWQPGDVVGCLLDLDQKQIIFSLNGVALPAFNQVFKQVQSGFFAAASFMSFQQCIFNFGASAFCFPPQNANFLSFNDYSILSPNEKVILPRRLKLEYLKKQIVKEDACTLCFDSQACSLLDPCHHGGFCERCAAQLETCPMCRAPINAVIKKM